MIMLRHRRLRSMLDAFADDELEPDAAQQVRAHLRTCWWCSGDVETLKLIKATLGSDKRERASRSPHLQGHYSAASAVVHQAREADGVRILTEHRLTHVRGDRQRGGQEVLEHEGSATAVPCDALLIAVGRTPRTRGLGLAAAGIETGARASMRVDRTPRTTNPRVWAAGDLTGHPQFTHVAGVHGSVAATNAVLGLRRAVDLTSVPRVTFTDPEVAVVGAATWPTGDAPEPPVVTRHHEHVDRAVTDGATSGFARLALGPRHRVIGATVVGPRAGESLGELVLAVRRKLTTSDLAGTTHAYPTYDDGPWNAALQDVQSRLETPLVRRLTRTGATFRRVLTRS